MLLTIDIGNTRIKSAVFEQDTLLSITVFEKKDAKKEFEKIFRNFPSVNSSIASTVSDLDVDVLNYLQAKTTFIEVNHTLLLPFVNHYTTPSTLGVDRIVLMAGVALLYPNENSLVIDCGTCITYDYLTDRKEYFGGAISPGLSMRYKALNAFTAKLPFLEQKKPTSSTGDSTANAIHSGIVNGISYEIEGFISQYSLKSEDLTVILTGGDADFLGKCLKSTIFVRSNFLLESLNAFFKYLTRDNE